MLTSGAPWRFDTTSVTRSGMGAGSVNFRRFETVVVDAGQGNDTVQLQGTQREQSPLGKSSTFTVNGGAGNDVLQIGNPVAGGGFTLDGFQIDITGSPAADDTRGVPVFFNGQGGSDTIVYLDTSATADKSLAFVNKSFAEIFPATAPATGADAGWVAQFTSIFGSDPTAGSYAGVVLNATGQAQPPINVYSRDAETVEFSLGAGNDTVQLFSGVYAYDVTVNGGAGNDTFNIERGVDNRGHLFTLKGQAGDDLVFANFEQGVPAGRVFVSFDGGTNSSGANGGDTLRIAGDGIASGTYTPSATVARSGEVVVGGNVFDFSGTEPLIVHGLAGFVVTTPDAAADLAVDSVNVADLNLTNLVLHTLTVDGVVTWTSKTNLFTPTAVDTRHAGNVSAISGNTLVVGAELVNATTGVVYVYAWNGSGWSEQAKLYAPDLTQQGGQGFGKAVAIDGDTIVVGSPDDDDGGTDAGAAYVFTRSGTTWTLQSKVQPTTVISGARFGQAVGVSGNSIVVGAAGLNSATNLDAAYVFTRSGSTWLQQQKLSVGGDQNNDFGAAVAIEGNTLIVGAPNAGASDTGTALVYTRSGSLWTLQKTLEASARNNFEHFGAAVDISGGSVIVGSPDWDGDGGTATDMGRAFIFEGSGANWVRVARLTASAGLPEADAANEGRSGDRFGAAVSIDGGYAAVGAPLWDGAQADIGAAYVFYQLPSGSSGLGSSWARSTGESGSGRLGAASPAGTSAEITPPYNTADRFGTSIALGGGRLVVGMPGHNETQGTTLLRPDVGGLRTFTTNGLLPTSNTALRADVLADPNGNASSSRFGAVSYYDAASRTLMVSDTGRGPRLRLRQRGPVVAPRADAAARHRAASAPTSTSTARA